MIEAKWLFGLNTSQIEVIIHPQSIVHSMVQFIDGSIKAQLGPPDMRMPIQYALAYPQRLSNDFPKLDFANLSRLEFEQPDTQTFRNLALAMQAMAEGGNKPCILNAANEIVVEAFLEDRVSFLEMPELIEKTLSKISFIATPGLEDYIATDKETREYTKTLI